MPGENRWIGKSFPATGKEYSVYAAIDTQATMTNARIRNPPRRDEAQNGVKCFVLSVAYRMLSYCTMIETTDRIRDTSFAGNRSFTVAVPVLL